MSWRVDERFSPIVLLQTRGLVSDQDLRSYVDQLDALTKRLIATNAKRVAIVVTDGRPIDIKERARMANEHKRLSGEQTARLISFMVFDNVLMRGALTAVGWLLPGKLGMVHAVSSYEQALNEALQLLPTLGLEAPVNLNELKAELSRSTTNEDHKA